MGEGCRSGFPMQRFDWQSSILNSLPGPLPFGLQSTNPPFMNYGTNMVSSAGTLPIYANPESPLWLVSQGNEPHGWSYCVPRQLFEPASNSFLKEQPLANPYESFKESGTGNIHKAGSVVVEKRFLVFDQSADQTTLILSSAFGTPTKCLTSWGPKPPVASNLNVEDPVAKVYGNIYSGPVSTYISDENGADVQSEMHEDTEELNALLYSDDESDYTEDDEVTSTGHSPSAMTAQDEQCERSCEDVASSTRLNKKRKLLDGCNAYSPLLMETANSGNPIKNSEYEDDAESSCANGQNPRSGDVDSSSGSKRMRKDKIRETVRVLRSIIPGGEGKDAVVVLDEAIDYLTSLKQKAKTLRPSTR